MGFVKKCPFEFSIQYPPRPEYFIEHFSSTPEIDRFQRSIPELLYIHIPFCETKCSYCFFATDHRITSSRMETYTNAILKEIEQYPLLKTMGVSCVDIGGGTPTILPESALEKLLSTVSAFLKCNSSNANSIETTPKQASIYAEKLNTIHSYGFNRISMGVQSFSSILLKNINRQQHVEEVSRAIENIHKAGFERLNIDLIFGLPNQTLFLWKQDLTQAISFKPDSITIYDCLYRGKGPTLAKNLFHLPRLDEIDRMYDWAYAYLTENGYYADYGSVNFSRHDSETGTSEYFERRLLWGEPFLGLGNYATTLYKGFWLFNNYKVDDYVRNTNNGNSCVEYCYSLPLEELAAKHILFSLNYGKINIDHFHKLFGVSLNALYEPELAFAQNRGWIRYKHPNLYLNNENFSNLYFLRSLFYSRSAKQWFYSKCQNGQ